ncbi:MAG TPA: YbaN family protein [Kiloniellales bacterium]|nr:YbaN family protein [Kiloniellales bacterium]
MLENLPEHLEHAATPRTAVPGRLARRAWLALAWVCVGLASAGVVLPLVPTTPFLLVAAWAAARSSPELQLWLLQHPRFGPLLRDWQEHRALRPRVKIVALLLIAASWVVTLATIESAVARGVTSVILLTVAIFLATRPSGPRREK